MQISAKQKQLLDIMDDPQVTELLIGGSSGGSKSYAIGLLVAIWAKKYPGIRFFVGRKTLKSLKQSTINTMLNKVFPSLGISRDEYAIHFQDMTLDFVNDSMVIFGELEYQPSDPEYNRYGSTEYDVAIIDEAGEVVKTAKDVLRSRVGRGVLSQKYGVPGKLLLASNPSQGWLKTEYYDVWSKLEGGDYRKWQIGEVDVDGEKRPAYRAFMRMSAYDNPFLSKSYIDNLKALPDVLRKKLLDGDWNYADEDNMLFKSGLLDKATTYRLPENRTSFVSYIGVDVSAGLGDKTVFTLVQDGVATGSFPSRVATNWDKTSQKPIFRLMADELIEFAQRNGFTSREASHIAVEGNGLGQALITTLKERGWFIREYTATHKSRSENYYQLSLDMDSGTIKLYHEMASYDNLRKELSGHTFKFENQTPSVCKKEDIKMRIGHSPDFADSLEIACWCLHQNTDKKGDRYNSNRIAF